MTESGPNNESSEEKLREGVRPEDIEPQKLKSGDTATFVARHGEYERDQNSSEYGFLTPEGYERVKKRARQIFSKMLKEMPEEERGNFYILLVASDADRGPGTGKRCIHTAEAWEEGAIEALAEFGLPPDQILNPANNLNIFTPDGSKIGLASELRDPDTLNKATADFMAWLAEKYGRETKEFFMAYESDVHADKRKEMGADGPLELAERLCKFLAAQQKLTQEFHKKYPGRRLAIANIVHYDNISPMLKTVMGGQSAEVALNKDNYVPVAYGGGFSYATRADGTLTKPRINGAEYNVPHC